MNYDPNRLKTALLNTGLQNKDTPLFQVIWQLIDALSGVNRDVNRSSISIQNLNSAASNGLVSDRIIRLEETEIIQEDNYMILGSSSDGGSFIDTYSEPLTNSDPINPELIFDSNGDVISASRIRL